ncbi:hypothetical protein BGX28_001533, partial [Mortierella sp. GBA30]
SWPSQVSSFQPTPVSQPPLVTNPLPVSNAMPVALPHFSPPQIPAPAPRFASAEPAAAAPVAVAAGSKRPALVRSTWQDKQPKIQTIRADLDEAHAANFTLQNRYDALMRRNKAQAVRITQLQDHNSDLQRQLQATSEQLESHSVMMASLQQAVKALQEKATAPPAAPVVAQPPPPQPAPRPAAATAPPAAAPAGPMSYAGAARQGLTAEQLDVIRLMKPAPRPFRARTTGGAATAANTPTVRVYFGNMQSCPLGLLKTRLRALRVRTSAIHNFAFVGKSICELLVEVSYKDELIAKMEQFTFRHLPNYDPAVPQDPNVTEDVRARLRSAYANRLAKTAGTTTRPLVRQVFLQMMADAAIPVPEDLQDNTMAAAVDAPAVAPIAVENAAAAAP